MSLSLNSLRWHTNQYDFLTDPLSSKIDLSSTATENRVSSAQDFFQINNTNSSVASSQPISTGALVSSDELEKISKEILTLAPSSQPVQSPAQEKVSPQVNFSLFNQPEPAVKVFGINSTINTETVKQIASNVAGLDVKLSDNAVSAIGALNSKAAALQSINMSNIMDGKIFAANPTQTFSNSTPAASSNNASSFFETGNLSKDGRSSNPFLLKNPKKENEQKNENVNIFI